MTHYGVLAAKKRGTGIIGLCIRLSHGHARRLAPAGMVPGPSCEGEMGRNAGLFGRFRLVRG